MRRLGLALLLLLASAAIAATEPAPSPHVRRGDEVVARFQTWRSGMERYQRRLRELLAREAPALLDRLDDGRVVHGIDALRSR